MRPLGPLGALLGLAGASAIHPLAPGHPDSLQTHHGNPKLQKRVGSGAGCGLGAGKAVCNPGLCCSEAGICGTGVAFCGAPGCQLSFGPACDGSQTPAGSDTSKVPRPMIGNVPYGVDISHCSVKGKVALTFDDGPYIYTTELLDLLKSNNVRATFFVVGNNGGKGHINDPSSGYAPIIRRMIADGHQVASHTWSHQDLNAATPDQRRAQIINNEIALNNILGVIPTYFRPPNTRCGPDCYSDLKSFGYHVVNYDIDTRDWQDGGVNAKSIYQTILSQHSPASSQWISLAHDVQPSTVNHLAQFMIDTARGLGYDLVTVGDCLGDPPANWYRDPVTGQARDARAAGPPTASSVSVSVQAVTSSGGSTATPATSTGTHSSSVAAAAVVTPTPVEVANFGLGHMSGSLDSTSACPACASDQAVSTTGVSTTLIDPPLAAAVVSGTASSAGGAGPRPALLSAILVVLVRVRGTGVWLLGLGAA